MSARRGCVATRLPDGGEDHVAERGDGAGGDGGVLPSTSRRSSASCARASHRTRQLCTNVLNIIETFRMVPANMRAALERDVDREQELPPGSIISRGGKVRRFIILEGEVRAGTD